MPFSKLLLKPQSFCFFVSFFFCHVVINSEDQRSTHSNYGGFSFNRSRRQRTSLKDCWARKNLIEGRHWSPLRFVFSWVNSRTVISPFVPPAKSMVYKSSQRRNRNTLSSPNRCRFFCSGCLWIGKVKAFLLLRAYRPRSSSRLLIHLFSVFENYIIITALHD